jgi:cytochrome c peroxidase
MLWMELVKFLRRTRTNWIVVLLSAMAVVAPSAWAADYVWQLPAWMKAPTVPDGNPMSHAKVELGRRLFFDIRLSGPGYMSCASCHQPARAFTDGRMVAIGVTGQLHTRNTPTLTNVSYLKLFGWANPDAEPLEVQLRRPMFGENPVEMGTLGHETPVLRHIEANSVYVKLFKTAFAEQAGKISFETIGKAIAAFQRTLVSGRSAYDKFAAGQNNALSAAARRGQKLFVSERMKCSQCHVPPFFTDATRQPKFHNTGLYNLDGIGGLPGKDQGLANETGNTRDIGKFRTPTLRNVQVSAPYMHDGSIATLAEVIDHYAAGGRAAQNGAASPLRSELIRGFRITKSERRELVAFLESLTDQAFLTEPRFQTPFR